MRYFKTKSRKHQQSSVLQAETILLGDDKCKMVTSIIENCI